MYETIGIILQEIQKLCVISYGYILAFIQGMFKIEILLAILGVYIARQQWQTNERTRKQDLFEKRYDNLYLPILKCSENILRIKDKKGTKDKKKQQIEAEIAEFWKQYNKYRFLISEKDNEKLNHHYEFILEIIQKNYVDAAEYLVSMLELIGHLTQMETLLAQYLRIESDGFIYKLKKCLRKKYSLKQVIKILVNSFHQNNENLQTEPLNSCKSESSDKKKELR